MAKRTTRTAAAIVAATGLIPLILTACSTASSNAQTRRAQSQADLDAPAIPGDAQIQRFRVDDWSAPNDHTVIIVANDGTRFRAQTLGPCLGLNFANRVGFVTRGGFNQIDRFSSVVLDDGTRCPFQSFERLQTPESKALDAYEKADEKPAQHQSSTEPDEKLE
jgi:hypothetical protein